ncbi:hypothetical protein Taro_002111 [Colocasia esculenta]|uniref:Uncharacterized protein n=1 Tax=Colocasia esculenta TaxID=4460 RepID=A0A843TKR6_COLES|nr:hypothetical protein [Colocasia esculenta]
MAAGPPARGPACALVRRLWPPGHPRAGPAPMASGPSTRAGPSSQNPYKYKGRGMKKPRLPDARSSSAVSPGAPLLVSPALAKLGADSSGAEEKSPSFGGGEHGCPRKPRNDRNAPGSQKTAGVSQKAMKRQKYLGKSINDENTWSRSEKSRNDQEAWLMPFVRPDGAGPTPFL